MKKSIIYLAIAAFGGLVLGYLLFSGNGSGQMPATPEISGVEEHDHSADSGSRTWTCSMHPQIMLPQPGDCPICGMDLIPAASGSEEISTDQIRMTENAMALADIRTTMVGADQPGDSGILRLSGKITENEEANTVQASYFDGRIEALDVTYQGQQIRQGQRLATLYSPGLVSAQQELLTAAPLKESQPGLYRAVRNKLKNWKLSDQQIDQIEKNGSVKEYFPVYATVSGTVTELMTSQGDYLKAGDPIAKLSNLSTVWADFDAYESQIDLFRTGQQITITAKAYPGEEFNARVSFIDPLLNTRTRTVTVRATLNNTKGLLKPGMFVTGEIQAEKAGAETSLTIPASAVMWTGQRSLVYVKIRPGEPVFEMREVSLGARVGDRFLITDGLDGGEEIVTNGAFTVDAAAQLQGKRSMMNPEVSMGEEFEGGGLSEVVGEALKKVIPLYMNLKDALVESDSEKAAEQARKMLALLEGQTFSNLPEEKTLDQMKESLANLAESRSLQEQRDQFRMLSERLISLARPLGSPENPLYLQYCPMANQNTGAYWLSQDSEIRNPYYGEAMLTCGEVRATWSGFQNRP